jgi:nicotinate-nucleotide--dimethylbenzimidazole phosphoribosyltransferase
LQLVVNIFINPLKIFKMQVFQIKPLSSELNVSIQKKIDLKTKPIGSLGQLEEAAFQVCRIQNSLSPKLNKPVMFVCAADHGITAEGVSPYPQEVTYQMVYNFLTGGAAINVFARQHAITLKVVDCGVNHPFEPHPDLINMKVAPGTANFAFQAAMTDNQCMTAMLNGARIVEEAYKNGSNVVGFGEMGIGNTTSATALFCKLCDVKPQDVSGAGTGLTSEGINHKAEVIAKAIAKHQFVTKPFDILATFGGFEIATMTGGMLKAAELGMLILVDGFITTSALLAAHAFNPDVLDYAIACHQSNEKGHQQMLKMLGLKPLLHLNLRLGEGTGAALAWPLIQSAVGFINDMSSFEGAGVSQSVETVESV